MESSITLAESTKKDLVESISKLSSMKEPSADEFVVMENVLEKQSFKLMTREQALEDLMYVQSKHFMSHGVDLATFMKWIRNTSRELFLTKALIKKISQAMAEPGSPSK